MVGRYVRIDLSQSQRPEAGRLVIGRTWQPSYDMQFGREPLSRDPSHKTFSLGRNVFNNRLPPERGERFSLRGLTLDEAENEIEAINRVRGNSQDVLVCRNINAQNIGQVTIWGLLEQPVSSSQREEGFSAEIEVWARS